MERTFDLSCEDLQIPCKVYEPDHCAPRRCVIGVHGFCGHKDNDVLVSIAEEMGIFGAATVRFDFPGHGDSPLSDRALSLRSCEMTLLNVAQWAQENYPDIPKCIFATGFGAFITVQCLDGLQLILEDVRLVLQTPDFHMADSLLAMVKMTDEAFRSAGRVTIGRTTDRKLEVPFSFYEEILAAVTYGTHDLPMLLLHGEYDEVVPLESVKRFHRLNELSRLVVIPGADHQFRGAGQWDMVVDLTRDWFEYEQVLLCDCE